ncbi:MAG: methionine adenosyltransferase [Flavobacteriaceae bacterium]|nr:methionine adenosyltransferase [Flavobacteriaceae bacterium]|tara:strand:+ start:5224 stop:6480 length:1257 start_codon:yes stop_codon:yes gene_type:complete
MSYFFTSESVSEGHPDKVADQISDALLDHFIAFDPQSKVACETLVTTGQVILSGEVKSKTYLDVQQIARQTINDIGYTDDAYQFSGNSCGVISLIHEQSSDINQGVEREKKEEQGAGDQGIMFGYASNETETYMPLALAVSHKILAVLADFRRSKSDIAYLRPDAKSQVTVEYSEDHKPIRIETVVVSTQHDDFDTDENMAAQIRQDIIKKVMPEVIASFSPEIQSLFSNEVIYHINPTGKFVIGGPHGDTGLTGRKIIVDTYGGKGAHGGGAFSGKDPSKVDRSAAYAARHIAKNAVAAGIADEILVQLSYAIGIAVPTSIFVDTYQTSHVDLSDSEIAKKLETLFDLTPYGIEQRLKLRTPIYAETAAYGHMGRTPKTVKKVFESPYNGKIVHEVELFTWEKLDAVSLLQSSFTIK